MKYLIMQSSGKIAVEHVVIHDRGDWAIIGLFMISPTLADAESAALAVSRAVLSVEPEFAVYEILRSEAPLLLDPGDSPLP